MISIPTGITYQTVYDLSEMAKAYLRHHHPARETALVEFTRKRNNLIKAADQMASLESKNPYDVSNVRMRSKGDIVPGRILREVLDLTRRGSGHYEEAEKRVQAAKELAPDYYEVYRVEALIHTWNKRLALAKITFENAIELEPNSPALRLFYGGCLLRIGDSREALSQFQRAEVLDPHEPRIKGEIARAHMYLHEFDEALVKLEKLLARKDLSSRLRTMFRDLYLQWFQRRAEAHAHNREFIEAEKIVRDLRESFENTPPEEIDHKSRERLLRCGPVLVACIRNASEIPKRRNLIALYLWLGEQSGIRPGIVTQIDVSEGSAIVTKHGIETRFQKDAVVPPEHWNGLKVGTPVFHDTFGNVSAVILAE